jgi:hypothetical protein
VFRSCSDNLRHDRCMADFLAVLGTVVFVAVMLGLIWGFERV